MKVYGIDLRETRCGDKKAACSRHVHSVCGAGNDEGKKLERGSERGKERAIENGFDSHWQIAHHESPGPRPSLRNQPDEPRLIPRSWSDLGDCQLFKGQGHKYHKFETNVTDALVSCHAKSHTHFALFSTVTMIFTVFFSIVQSCGRLQRARISSTCSLSDAFPTALPRPRVDLRSRTAFVLIGRGTVPPYAVLSTFHLHLHPQIAQLPRVM